jgi:hypothetical protein
MKARQLSVSFASVYALGLLDQARLIRRGPDGFWGPWEATGVNAKRLVHAGTVVAVIGLDDRVAVYDQLPGRVRHTWDFQASELSVAPLPRGGAVLFALSAGRVWWAWKPSLLGPWTDWEPLGGPAEKLAAAAIPRHGTTVCCANGGVVYGQRQTDPTLEWSPRESLGSPGGGVEDLALTVAGRAGLALFVLGQDGAVYHRWKDRPGAPWQDWVSLGGLGRSLSVSRTASGGLALFVTGPDGRVGVRHQNQPFARWMPWLDLHGDARAVLGQQSYTEGLEAFVLGTDDEVRHAWCARVGTPWTEWQLLDREAAGLRHGPDREDRVSSPAG